MMSLIQGEVEVTDSSADYAALEEHLEEVTGLNLSSKSTWAACRNKSLPWAEGMYNPICWWGVSFDSLPSPCLQTGYK
jgi:hypothetical protein